MIRGNFHKDALERHGGVGKVSDAVSGWKVAAIVVMRNRIVVIVIDGILWIAVMRFAVGCAFIRHPMTEAMHHGDAHPRKDANEKQDADGQSHRHLLRFGMRIRNEKFRGRLCSGNFPHGQVARKKSAEEIPIQRGRSLALGRAGKDRVDLGQKLEARILLPAEDAP